MSYWIAEKGIFLFREHRALLLNLKFVLDLRYAWRKPHEYETLEKEQWKKNTQLIRWYKNAKAFYTAWRSNVGIFVLPQETDYEEEKNLKPVTF